MSPFNTEYMVYFPHNVDFVLCPKNAHTTVRVFHNAIVGVKRKVKNFKPVHEGAQNWRTQQCMNFSDITNYPFRKDSFKVAIKRDPVMRFCSTINTLEQGKISLNSRKYKSGESLETVISRLESGQLFDTHLLPQNYYMGDKSKYDRVYDISEVEEFLNFCVTELKMKPHSKFYTEGNGKQRYNKTDSQSIYDQLSLNQIDRIKAVYQKDYDGGWC